MDWKSLGGVKYRAAYATNNTSKTYIAMWCYKLIGLVGMGLDGIRVR